MAQLQPGQPLGEYILDAPIGHGATGEVWRAHHHVWNDRVVAVKIPTNPEFLRGIRKEGLVHDDLSRLDSPHIVRIHGLNLLSTPPYLVMEFVDGSDLRKRLSGGKLTLPETLRIVEGVLKGLNSAHESGIVHRDIKPENILLDKQGTPKLSDFSIATKAPTTETLRMSLETDLEGAASLAGTLVYMSPEQRSGGRIDRRSDIYSMGLLLFEMLTGELPQPGDRIADFVRGIAGEIDDIFARCFTRYERRYADAGEMLQAVQALRHPRERRATVLVSDSGVTRDRYEPERPADRPSSQKEHGNSGDGNVQKSSPPSPIPAPRKRVPLSTRDLNLRDTPVAAERKPTSVAISTREFPEGKEPQRSMTPVASERAPAAKEQKKTAPKPALASDIAKLIDDLPDDVANGQETADPRPSRAYDEVLPSLAALYKRYNTSRGMGHYAAGNYQQAEEEFRQLAKRNPQDAAAK
ncbi:MAG: serine/threonine protein kinase, partial [Planctomycetes bacterium]|nr:serine/threonine protein kinase [Planctomycetota bacterium]